MTCTAESQDVSGMYRLSELQNMADRYGPNLRAMWEQDFLSRLTQEEQIRGGSITLRLPLVGRHRHPLEFYANPSSRQVFLPIASVKFVDDLAVAFAYYEKKGCELGAISDYAGALPFHHTTFSPTEALGVPAKAIDDPKVDDVAQKILKSAVYFLAAHEFAHVMNAHKNDDLITAAEAQKQEIQSTLLL